ncbi:MAG: 4-vinyl reductase [Nitrososphaerota archaeon]|nr:4-vinyl reductase [Nitrososphaerota archaeon]MDG6903319.1 4-vinyl reductase [Nitrososphaerota archaeon]MDG6911819.1 4-vinyl reductase [Nitrososphaerota archaeon]MDG6940698.1 4-vinyl reductase [Nitrososphaerota archaeon]MDG6961009.1 4-vinyl reductase [Nitrososphaerota archaeon]
MDLEGGRPTVANSASARKEDQRSARVLTGHPVLDSILNVYEGTSILMLDETYSEARNVMQLIAEQYNSGLKFTEITDRASLANTEHVEVLTGESLADKVVRVNAIRRKHRDEVIIHSYLPSLLISQSQENVLKYVDSWKNAAKEFGTVEVYLMPSNSFKDAERKMIAILDCRIEFSVSRKEERMVKNFVVSGCCRPEFNLREFEYLVEDGRLLIKWDGQLTDRPSIVSEDLVETRFVELKEKPATFILRKGFNASRGGISVVDYALVSQLEGRSLEEAVQLYPEKAKELLQQFARWEQAGVVEFDRDYARNNKPVEDMEPDGYSPLNFFRLLLPDRIVAWSYQLGTQSVPLQYFAANRDAFAIVIDMLMERSGIKNKQEYLKSMYEVEKSVFEMSARKAALAEVPRHHESTAAAAAKKYIPKVVRVALLSAFILRSNVKRITGSEYHVVVEDCYLCKDHESKDPMCASISGALEGISGTVFKLKATCEEVRCRATGDSDCEFRLKLS